MTKARWVLCWVFMGWYLVRLSTFFLCQGCVVVVDDNDDNDVVVVVEISGK